VNVTLDKEGKILDSNLTAVSMLGIERRHLLQANISKFVVRESQDDWYLFRHAAFSRKRNKHAKSRCGRLMLRR
jgi:hypothetical protein